MARPSPWMVGLPLLLCVRTPVGAAQPADDPAMGPSAGAAAGGGTGESSGEILVPEGRTTILQIEPSVGHPIERDPDFLAKVPSYRRALETDGVERWGEAVGLYQQAVIEVGAAFKLASTPLLEHAAIKVEIELRRSQALTALQASNGPPRRMRAGGGGPLPRGSLVERGRLLRQKMMAVRAGTGEVPAGLVSATLSALDRALHLTVPRAAVGSRDTGGQHEPPGTRDPLDPRNSRNSPDLHDQAGDPDVRLLLCATRAVAGDRKGARIELAHVAPADRLDPARALGVAVCAAALGRRDDAIASLAVALLRLGPPPRSALLQLGQARDLYTDNDWDSLRGDPRFERLFR